jgi:TonB family protein
MDAVKKSPGNAGMHRGSQAASLRVTAAGDLPTCEQKIIVQGHKEDCTLKVGFPLEGICHCCGHNITVQGHKEDCQFKIWQAWKPDNKPGDATPHILEKPRPEYTAEGRSMRIEGDVIIELVYLADGSIQINYVVSGLGHRLDESAVRAAQQIKFQPATVDGEPVDFPTRVRIEFRLAYGERTTSFGTNNQVRLFFSSLIHQDQNLRIASKFVDIPNDYPLGHLLSMCSSMKFAWLIAFSTAATFAGLGLSESSSISLRAHSSVAAKRTAYFLSSVIGNSAIRKCGRGGEVILQQVLTNSWRYSRSGCRDYWIESNCSVTTKGVFGTRQASGGAPPSSSRSYCFSSVEVIVVVSPAVSVRVLSHAL